ANAYGNLGAVYQTRSDLDQAIEHWEKSLALFQQVGAKDRIDLLQSWLNEVKQSTSK
ncbi:MAG: tetratricopeptide repeat protein, partial [Proteobacteria bacterium]|nr:tetratricopeptide repeat protein [Pseudomonadota bacterium]